MKKKYFIIIILLIVLAITLYFVMKLNNYKKYYLKNDNYVLSNETISIEHKEEKDLLDYNNIKIKNIFKKYIFEDNTYMLIDKEDEITQMFSIDISDTYIDIFINGINSYESIDDELIDKEQRKAFIKDNNINNDIDLINTLIKYMNNSFDIFSNTNDLKTYAYINYYLSNVFSLVDDYTEIKGDYKGIIISDMNMEYESSYIVNLYDKNNKRYILTFIGNELSREDIIKLIGTVIINEE